MKMGWLAAKEEMKRKKKPHDELCMCVECLG